MKKNLKKIISTHLWIILTAAVFLSGCQVGLRPRLRVSDFFGDPGGMVFPDPNNLGPHCLDKCHDEKTGMLYTCKGGFVDLGHLREAADRAYCISQITYENLMKSNKTFSYRVIEPAHYDITLGYPDNWDQLSQQNKEAIARDVSRQLGQYLAHTSLIWHEIVTWYGFASSGLFSENISAFSWEDPFSDVLGTRLAAITLNDPAVFYDEDAYENAMTVIIDKTLKKLDVQPRETAIEAANKVKGVWYEGGYYFFVTMKKRNLDVGLEDGAVTPWLVPGICPDAVPKSCPSPNFRFLDKYGFKIRVRMNPVEFQKIAIYKTLGLKWSDQLIPHIHFPMLIESIRKEAKELIGDDVDTPDVFNWKKGEKL